MGGGAFLGGLMGGLAEGVGQRVEEKRAQKRLLADEERQGLSQQYIADMGGLRQKLADPNLPHDSPERAQISDDLNALNTKWSALYHPENNANPHIAFQELGQFFSKNILHRPQQTPMQTVQTRGPQTAEVVPVAGAPAVPSATAPAMGGGSFTTPALPAIEPSQTVVPAQAGPLITQQQPIPTAAEAKQRTAELMSRVAQEATPAPANPYLQLRDQLKAAFPNMPEEDLQKAIEVHAKVIGAPAAEKPETWKPLGKPYAGKGGVIFQNQQDTQGNVRQAALPEGTVLPAPVAHLSNAATLRADYARAKGISPDELTFQDDLDMTSAIKQVSAGMTVSDQIRFVSQPDGTIKAVPVRQTSQKLFSGVQPSSILPSTPPTVEETAGIPEPVAPARPGGIISGTNSLGHPITEDSTGKVTDTVTGQVTQLPGRYVGTSPTTPQHSPYMAVANPKGLVEPGNLPIWNRPTVRNADGTHSSEYSTSFADDQGREVLVPTVVNGKFLTPDGKKPPKGSPQEKAMFQRAWQHYIATGENLGKFDNAANANSYSQILHNRGSAQPATTPADLKARAARVQSAAGMAESKGTGFVQGGDIVGGRATSAQTAADKVVNTATQLVSLADDAMAAPSAAKDKNLALAIIRGAAGRVNMQEYNILTQRAGLGNTLEAWANSATTGQLPADIRKQLVDVAHSSLRAAQAGQQASRRPAGSTTTYKQTATGPNNHKIGSNDGGNTWFDVQTGQPVQVP